MKQTKIFPKNPVTERAIKNKAKGICRIFSSSFIRERRELARLSKWCSGFDGTLVEVANSGVPTVPFIASSMLEDKFESVILTQKSSPHFDLTHFLYAFKIDTICFKLLPLYSDVGSFTVEFAMSRRYFKLASSRNPTKKRIFPCFQFCFF